MRFRFARKCGSRGEETILKIGVKSLVLGALVAMLVAGAMVRPTPAAPPSKGDADADPLSALIGQCVSLALEVGGSTGTWAATLTDVSPEVLGIEVSDYDPEIGEYTIPLFVSRKNVVFVIPPNPYTAPPGAWVCIESDSTSSIAADKLMSRLRGSGSQ
jgi:hypothetical protein